jgi:hypothetical protein
VDGDGDLDAFVVNSDRPGEVWLNERFPLNEQIQPHTHGSQSSLGKLGQTIDGENDA